MKGKTFIQCGFEFTAVVKGKKEKYKSKVFEVGSWSWTDSIEHIYGGTTISKVKWIQENIESDDCGLEIPSPKATTKEIAIKYFNQFKRFVVRHKLSIDINTGNNALGGCHIHLDTTPMTKAFRKKFLINVAIFLSNNPQLNWGFNDVNDNYNANSLLNDDYYAFSHDGTMLTKFIRKPLAEGFAKRYALRYNQGYQTLELRIFDMPKNLKQHILHSDVAQAIYQYCLIKTNRGERFVREYKKISDCNFTLSESINRFNKTMNAIGIETRRTKEQIRNIETRYLWNKQMNEDDIDTNYLV